MSNAPTQLQTSNAGGYKLTVHMANSFVTSGIPEKFIPHAFVTISGPNINPPITVGYYPAVTGVSGAGTVRNDAISHKNDVTGTNGPHPFDRSVSFEISPQQALNAVNFAADTANKPGQYQLLGAPDRGNAMMLDGYQCTGFARDIAIAAGIEPKVWTADNGLIRAYPGWLGPEFSGVDSNQNQPYRSSPTDTDFQVARASLNMGITTYDPSDPAYQATVNDRTVPVVTESANASNNNITQPVVDELGNVISGGTPPTEAIPPTGTPFRVEVSGVNEVASNILKVTQNVLGSNATAPDAILDPNTGEITGYKVSSFDSVGETGGVRIVLIFNADGSLKSGETQLLANGKIESEPLDASTTAAIKAGLVPNITIESSDPAGTNDGASIQNAVPATTAPAKSTTDKINSDDDTDETPAFTPIAATKDLPPDQVITLADSGNGTQTDGGKTTGYGNGSETDTPVADVNIDSSAANNVANPENPANTPATTAPYPTLPVISDDGYDPIDYVDTRDPTAVYSVDAVSGSDLASDQTRASIDANNAAGALGLANTLIGLENWDNASDFSRVQTVVGLYNQVNNLAGLGMPNMGGLGAGLGFIGAVQNGDFGGMVVGAIGVGNAVGSAMDMGAMAVSEAIGAALGMSAVNVIPGLNLIFALSNIEENPLGVVIAALALIPVYGQIIAVVLSICQALFTPAPVSEGEAHATFDATGNIIVTTDSEKNGGGSTANHWMEQLAKGAQLAGLQTPQAGAYTVGMPTVGYRYNPEGFNDVDKNGETINGQLTLRWVDPNGVAHSRVYAGDGTGALGWGDEKDENIGDDFLELMQSAVKQYPPLAYQQLDGGVLQLDYGVATVVYATNTRKFDGMAEHMNGGGEDTDAAQDEAIVIEDGDKRMRYDRSQTVENTSKQIHVKVAASDLHTVVNPIIAPIQTKGDLIDVGNPAHGQVVLKDDNCYIFNSYLGNKYAGYSLKIPSKPAYLLKTAQNDDLFTLAA